MLLFDGTFEPCLQVARLGLHVDLHTPRLPVQSRLRYMSERHSSIDLINTFSERPTCITALQGPRKRE